MVLHRQHPYCVRDKILFRELLGSPTTVMSSVASNDNAVHNTERLLVNSSGGPFIVSQQSSPASSAQSSPSCAGKRSAGEHSGASDAKRTRGGNSTRKE